MDTEVKSEQMMKSANQEGKYEQAFSILLDEKYNWLQLTYHFFESSYVSVEGIDTRAESTFLNEPPFTLHSIYRFMHYLIG